MRDKVQHRTFVETRLHKKEIHFHDPIKRNTVKGFNYVPSKKKAQIKKNVEVNRDILARLIYLSNSSGRIIDFEKVLTYPLSNVPLSLCNPNGAMRKTNKSKLSQLLLSKTNRET
jgi:hypothetical protein